MTRSGWVLLTAGQPSRPVVTLAWASLITAGVCALILAADGAIARRQHMAVMYFVWPLTALYAGPLALAAYFAIGRPAARSTDHSAVHHSRPPLWRSTVLGATHCGAGCMLGDVLADGGLFLAGATALLGSALLTSYVFDFIAAYLLGIVFQYFAIVPMRKLSPARGLLAAIKADTLSLIAFQVGMYAWMAIFQKGIFHPHLEADSPVFWFMMQIGMLAGFLACLPMNALLVKTGVKEAMR